MKLAKQPGGPGCKLHSKVDAYNLQAGPSPRPAIGARGPG